MSSQTLRADLARYAGHHAMSQDVAAGMQVAALIGWLEAEEKRAERERLEGGSEPMQDPVVHVLDRIPGAVYVGRPHSKVPDGTITATGFGNPFKLRRDTPEERARVCDNYRGYVLSSPSLLHNLPRLRGSRLSCWCRHFGYAATPVNRCHADVLIELLAEFTNDDLWRLEAALLAATDQTEDRSNGDHDDRTDR